ncbi:MAG: hypothetical protein EP343_07010 [Deltaproteobacteria bacterium]|nr:MAG: hypothetical protein EP343_07010 [Deltaproteobacteria bacterium]
MTASLPSSPTSYQFGVAFHRVRYLFHTDFFTQLSLSEPDILDWTELAELFDDVWQLCVRSASSVDLDDHLPDALGASTRSLVEFWKTWNIEHRGEFLRGLEETLRAEADGDEKRGRKRLSAHLNRAVHLIAQIRSALSSQQE